MVETSSACLLHILTMLARVLELVLATGCTVLVVDCVEHELEYRERPDSDYDGSDHVHVYIAFENLKEIVHIAHVLVPVLVFSHVADMQIDYTAYYDS